MESKESLEQELKVRSAEKWVNDLFILFERLAKMKDRYDMARQTLEPPNTKKSVVKEIPFIINEQEAHALRCYLELDKIFWQQQKIELDQEELRSNEPLYLIEMQQNNRKEYDKYLFLVNNVLNGTIHDKLEQFDKKDINGSLMYDCGKGIEKVEIETGIVNHLNNFLNNFLGFKKEYLIQAEENINNKLYLMTEPVDTLNKVSTINSPRTLLNLYEKTIERANELSKNGSQIQANNWLSVAEFTSNRWSSINNLNSTNSNKDNLENGCRFDSTPIFTGAKNGVIGGFVTGGMKSGLGGALSGSLAGGVGGTITGALSAQDKYKECKNAKDKK